MCWCGWSGTSASVFAWGELGVGIPGDFEVTAPTPSSSSSESKGEEPAVTKLVSLVKGSFGRYGAPMYPFDPEERGSVAPIRRYDGPGTLGEVTEENKGEWHDSSSSNSCSSSCSSGWMGLGVENQLSRLIRGKRGGQKHVSSTCFVCCASCVFLG